MWNLFTVLILFWVSLSIKRHDVAENPNPYYPTPTNVLLEGVHTYMSISRKRDANVDPRWAEKSEGKRPRTRRRKFIGDESPPWAIQRPLRSTLEVRFVDDKLCLKNVRDMRMRMHASFWTSITRIAYFTIWTPIQVTQITEMTVFTKITPEITGMTLQSTEMTL